MSNGSPSWKYNNQDVALTPPNIAPRLKKVYGYTSIPLLACMGELYLSRFYLYCPHETSKFLNQIFILLILFFESAYAVIGTWL